MVSIQHLTLAVLCALAVYSLSMNVLWDEQSKTAARVGIAAGVSVIVVLTVPVLSGAISVAWILAATWHWTNTVRPAVPAVIAL